jgi:hypothetical protein
MLLPLYSWHQTFSTFCDKASIEMAKVCLSTPDVKCSSEVVPMLMHHTMRTYEGTDKILHAALDGDV